MIKKITMEDVASFKQASHIDIDINKKHVLLYGLNGTGKTTLSNFLAEQSKGASERDQMYKKCEIEGLDTNTTQVLVYNQKFIEENFYTYGTIKGIFTLSKENKEAEEKIAELKDKQQKQEKNRTEKQKEKAETEKDFKKYQQEIVNSTWEIKTDYEHDTEFKFCLDGFKGKKEDVFSKIMDTPYNESEMIDIETLRPKAQSISDNAQKVEKIEEICFSAHDIETSELFAKQIVGNIHSSVSTFIQQFNNSDWLKTGFEKHVEHHPENETCPFCHQKTITETWKEDIKNYFDKSYQNDIDSLKDLQESYEKNIQDIPPLSFFTENKFFKDHENDFTLHYHKFEQILTNNTNHIKNKIQNPSNTVNLENSTYELNELNTIIQRVNTEITQHNNNIDNKNKVREEIKTNFWKAMRHKYKGYIESYQKQEEKIKIKIDTLDTQIKDITSEITLYNTQISAQQKNTINIEEAVQNINNNLQQVGIDDFSVCKTSDSDYYFLKRTSDDKTGSFKTFSEGEKMIISFLYFIELCHGKKSKDEEEKQKIIVIDDPISSLAHNHIFNVAQLIKLKIFKKPYEQFFIFTHSLYFFHEFTKIVSKKEKEKMYQYIRIKKTIKGSQFQEMQENEILNEYQSYWEILKDKETPDVVIANTMRNILEYFFGFIGKKKLHEVFVLPELQPIQYQAFWRHINRESHSDMQNIIDFTEFDYDNWKNAFKQVFELSGHADHYNSYMGI